MEVAVLTTRLEAQISAFQAQMAAAERMLKEVQKVMRDLERTTIELQATINDLGVDASKMDKSIVSLAKVGKQVDDLTTQFKEANKAAKDLSIPVSQTVANVAKLKEETAATNDLAEARRDAADAGRFRVVSNPLTGGQSIMGPTGRFMSPEQARAAGFNQLQLPAATPLGRRDFLADPNLLNLRERGMGMPTWTPRNMFQLGGGLNAASILAGRFGETEPHREALRAAEDIKVGSSFLSSIGKFFSGGGGSARRGIGNFFGRGGPGGFFQGILPGGRRAGAGAVLTGLGLAAAAGPAVGVGAGGLLGALPNMIGTLVGAGATLKLAFADISAAAFTSKAAFDALTPVQQDFVQNLRSIDTGFTRPLERLASSNLLPKLSSAINSAITPSSIAASSNVVTAFSNSLGSGAKTIGKFLGSPQFDQQLQQMLVGDASGIQRLATAFTHLLDAVVRIANAALPFTNWLENVGVKASKAADAFIKTQQASGGLANFFQRAKASLQAIAGLVEAVGKAIGALGNAIGLKNSIALIKLVSTLFQDLADLLNHNRALFNNVLAGLIKAAGDLLAVLKFLIQDFLTILGTIQKLIQPLSNLTNGVIGLRGAVDGLLAVLALRWVTGWLVAVDKSLVLVGTLRANLLRLALLRIIIPVVIASSVTGPLVALWGKVFGTSATEGIQYPDFSNALGGDSNMRTPNIPGATGQKDARGYDINSPEGQVYLAGLQGRFPAHMTRAQALRDPAFQTGLRYRLQSQQKNIGAAIINLSRGLTPTGGTVIPGVDVPLPGHGKPAPFSVTGGGGIGFTGPTSAGGAVFGAQQALQQAMTRGSGASTFQQVQLAKQYEQSAAAAYTHLKNQHVAAKDIKAKQTELTALLRDEGQARKDITTILQRQVVLNTQVASSTVTAAKANFNLAKSAGGSYRDLNDAANRYLAVLHKQQAVLEGQVKSGKNAVAATKELKTITNDIKSVHIVLEKAQEKIAKAHAKIVDDSRRTQIAQHQTSISALRSNLSSGVSGATTPQGILDVVNKIMRAASGQYAYLYLLLQKLKDQTVQTAKLKAEENQIRREMNSTLGVIHTAEKDQAKAMKAQAQNKFDKIWEKAFGLGTGESASIQSVRRTERNALLHIVRTLPHATGTHAKGMTSSTDPLGAIPGAAGMSIGQLIKSLQSQGVTFSKRALADFKLINNYLADAQKEGRKVNPAIRDKITSLLQQIEQNTRPATQGFSMRDAVVSEQQILKNAGVHITGTKAQRSRFFESMNEWRQNHHRLFKGAGSVMGVPLNPDGTPALLDPTLGIGLPGHVSGRGHIRGMGRDEIYNPAIAAWMGQRGGKMRPLSRQLQGIVPGYNSISRDIGSALHAVKVAATWVVHNRVQEQDNAMMKLQARLANRGHLTGADAVSIVESLFYHPYNKREGATANAMAPQHVTININGFNKDMKELAKEIAAVLHKNSRRNTTLMTGANAGRNLGAGLG